MQHFAIEDLQCQRILHQLLDSPLQRPRAEVGIEAFSEGIASLIRSTVSMMFAPG